MGKAVLLHLSLKKKKMKLSGKTWDGGSGIRTQVSGWSPAHLPQSGSGQREEGSLPLEAIGYQGGKPWHDLYGLRA